MNTQSKTGITVLVFGQTPVPRALGRLPILPGDEAAVIDEAARDSQRLVVAGSDADLAMVLSRLMRTDALDVEVAHVRPGLLSRLDARRAVSGTARRVPLIRDDTGTALVGAALWLPAVDAMTVHGEAVVDDMVLFDGDVAGVRIEPTAGLPGLRATVLGRRGWVAGRAAQLGTTGARVTRDGVPGTRQVKRSTFYRHTTGWLKV